MAGARVRGAERTVEDDDDEEGLEVGVDSESHADEEAMQKDTKLEGEDPHQLRQYAIHFIRSLSRRSTLKLSVIALA